MKTNDHNLELLTKKIEIILSLLGMSAQYISFIYLQRIIYDMIIQDDDSLLLYQSSLNQIMKEYNISSRSIAYGLKKIITKCPNTIITSKPQFNLKHHATLNKIRIIKNYILEQFTKM